MLILWQIRNSLLSEITYVLELEDINRFIIKFYNTYSIELRYVKTIINISSNRLL